MKRSMLSGWIRRTGAVVTVLALALSACSGGGSTASGTDASDGAAQSEVDPNGVLNVGYDLAAPQRGGFTFDPTKNLAATVDDGIYYAVYGRLMRPTESGAPEPDLAESARVVDSSTIEIVTRDGATFQDGAPFDAAAVKAGLEYSLSQGNQAAYSKPFFNLASIDVLDPRTLRLNFPTATASSWFDSFIDGWQSTIVRPGDDFTMPVGAGPMRVTSFTPSQSMDLAKADGYWEADAILPGSIAITNIDSSQIASGVAAVKAGQIDYTLSDIASIPSLTGDAGYILTPDASHLSSMMICKSDGPLADARVRRAINKAIDRDAINEAIFAGTAEPANQLWPSSSRFYDPSLEDELSYDVDGARELLQEAGYPDGFEFDAYTLATALMPETAQIIQQDLQEIGVTMNIVLAPNFIPDFLDPPRPGLGVVSASPPGRARLNQWVGDQLSNVCRWNDPELNSMADDLAKVSDNDPEGAELWAEINKKVVDEALSGFLFWGSSVTAYNTAKLGGAEVFPDANITFPDLRRTWVQS